MDPKLLAQIVEKAASECHVTGISLFNWTEPLLHPALSELICVVQDADIPCHLSSNLNLLPDADNLMASNPASLKISTSGFTQAVYGHYHRGGDIERVKRNMTELAMAKKRNNATTNIFVAFHRYRNNLKEELLMRDFAASLGFGFVPEWALMFPLEKVLAYAGEPGQDFPLTEEDRQLINRLAYPLKETLDAVQKYQSQPCCLRDSQICLDFQGNVILCCGVFGAEKFSVGNYLSMTLDDIQKIRQAHSMCNLCKRNGVHAYFTSRLPEMEQFILETISAEDAELLEIRSEFAKKHVHQYLRKIYQKYLSGIITKDQKTVLEGLVKRALRVIVLTRKTLRGKG